MIARWLVVFLVACGASPNPPPVTATHRPQPARPRTPPPPPKAPADSAARVGGEVIKIADVDRRIDATVKANIAAITDPAERAYRLAEERLRVVNDMIDERVLVAAALRDNSIEVTEADLDDTLKQIRTTNNLTEADFEKVLTDQGYTVAEYRIEVRNQILVLKLLNRETIAPDTKDEVRRRLVERHRATAMVSIDLQLPPQPAQMSPPVQLGTLDVSALITNVDLERVLKRKLPGFETGRLADEPGTATYDSWHFKAKGKPESNDAAFRVWRGPAKTIEDKWKEITTSLPNVVKGGKLGTAEAFQATEQGLVGIGFIDRGAGFLVLVTCGTALCKSPADARAIATLIQSRLDRLK